MVTMIVLDRNWYFLFRYVSGVLKEVIDWQVRAVKLVLRGVRNRKAQTPVTSLEKL